MAENTTTENTTTEKRVALITGANKGIGKEIARRLGAEGMSILVGARDAGRGAEAAKELAESGLDAHSVMLDVTDEASVGAAVRQIEADYGRLDVLVNNAGIAVDKVPPGQSDLDTLRRTYETNVFGVFAVTKTFLPLLRQSEAGRIVNLSSGLGSLTQNSDPNYEYTAAKGAAYNSSKAALKVICFLIICFFLGPFMFADLTHTDPVLEETLTVLKLRLAGGLKATPLCLAVIGWLCETPTDPAIAEIHRGGEGMVWLRLSDETRMEPLCAFLEFLSQVRVICASLSLSEAQTQATVAWTRQRLG